MASAKHSGARLVWAWTPDALGWTSGPYTVRMYLDGGAARWEALRDGESISRGHTLAFPAMLAAEKLS